MPGFSKRTFKRKKRKDQVKKNKKDIAYLKRGLEHKFVEDNDETINMDSTAAIYPLNDAITQGDTQTTREGNKVSNRKLSIKGYFANTGANAADCVCRIIIFKIKQNKGATPAIANLLNNVDSVNSHSQPNKTKDFSVFYDHTFTMDTTQMSLIAFKYDKVLRDSSQYLSDAGTVAGIDTNLYCMAVYSSITDNPGTLDSPSFLFDYRFSFIDI